MALQTLVVSTLVHTTDGNYTDCWNMDSHQNRLVDTHRFPTRFGMDGALSHPLAPSDEAGPSGTTLSGSIRGRMIYRPAICAVNTNGYIPRLGELTLTLSQVQ